MELTEMAQPAATLVAAIAVVVAAYRVAAALRHTRAEGILRTIEHMERVRGDRRVVYRLSGDVETWNDEQKAAVDRVSRAFDILGILYKEKIVPRAFLRDFYAVPTVRSWKRCQAYVFQQRGQRKQPRHLKAFEDLADECGRLRPDALHE